MCRVGEISRKEIKSITLIRLILNRINKLNYLWENEE